MLKHSLRRWSLAFQASCLYNPTTFQHADQVINMSCVADMTTFVEMSTWYKAYDINVLEHIRGELPTFYDLLLQRLG